MSARIESLMTNKFLRAAYAHELRERGWKLREIAKDLGRSNERVRQMCEYYERMKRARDAATFRKPRYEFRYAHAVLALIATRNSP